MTSKEALNKIGATTYYDWNNKPLSEHFKEEFEMIKKSLTELEGLKKRDTPMQPEARIDSRGRLDFMCLNCGRDVVLKEYYCPHCGQRLDWSYEK